MSTLGVEEVSQTSGVLDYVLGGATPNSWRFADKVNDGAEVTYYATDGARSEYGRGRFELLENTLVRVTIINSSQGDAKVNWPDSGQRIISLLEVDPSQILSIENDLCDECIPEGGECGQIIVRIDGPALEWQWRPYPIAAWVDGGPVSNQKIRLAVTEPLKFVANFSGSYAYADTAPSDSYGFTVIVNRITSTGSTIELGTLTWEAGETVAYWLTTNNEVQYLFPGDRVEYLFPLEPDTIEDISITARAIIICLPEAVVRLEGGPFVGLPGDYIDFTLSTMPTTADTLLMAGWMGFADVSAGHGILLAFAQESPGSHITVTIGDGTTIPEGSFGFVFEWYDASSVEVVKGYVEIPVDLRYGWHAFAISMRASTQTLQILVDGVLYSPAGTLAWYSTNPFGSAIGAGLKGLWTFGGPQAGSSGMSPAFTFTPGTPVSFAIAPHAPDMSFGPFRLGMGETYFDLSIGANERLLFGDDGRTMVDWGTTGELITGTAPALYLTGGASTFAQNPGSSGAGTVAGELEDFRPPPPEEE